MGIMRKDIASRRAVQSQHNSRTFTWMSAEKDERKMDKKRAANRGEKKGTKRIREDTEVKGQVDAFVNGIGERSDQLIHQRLPSKIFSLGEYLDTMKGMRERVLSSCALPPVSGGDGSTKSISVNTALVEIMVTLKAEIVDLLQSFNTIKVWIQLNVPRIEDGNNFGVSVQEEIIETLSHAEDSAYSFMDSMAKYHITRAKIASKLLKYPALADYRFTLQYLDQKQYLDACTACADLRNDYSVLYDVIIKNLAKLKAPRTTRHSALMM
eukprot:gnl/Trimastix_PCT/633.p1 GENE.gnl/Trimastix_PCT/633~~gnl/Trimastix_PCT/633.p1  ORF type:complete len:268 (+),score=54.44 gnl/Trimastix_PCT/633:53-856(+)